MKPYYKGMQTENKSRQCSDCMDTFTYLFIYMEWNSEIKWVTTGIKTISKLHYTTKYGTEILQKTEGSNPLRSF
jgi:hypothetical protein